MSRYAMTPEKTEMVAGKLHGTEEERSLLPGRPLHLWFLEILRQGTGKEFATSDNDRWTLVTRPIVEAFFHARFFLEMAVRYGMLQGPPPPLPSGYARCGSGQGVQELAERLSRDGSWSVFTGLSVPFTELARSCRNNQVRRTTVEAILKAGGLLRPSSGPPHHHDLYGLTPQQFDAILSLAEPNPVPKPDRWKPL